MARTVISRAWANQATQDTLWQDNTSPPMEHWLSVDLVAVTLQANAVRDTHTLVFDPFSITGILAGDGHYVEIKYVDLDNDFIRFFQSEIVTITDNTTNITIEIALPLDFNLDITKVEGAVISETNFARASVIATPTAPVYFDISPPDYLKWDLTRVMITGIMEGAPDDGKFFDQPALTWGVFFGFKNPSYALYLADVKENAGFRASAYDVNYTSRTVPAGSYGLSVRKTFSGQDKYGVAVRLRGETSDRFIAVAQEDFSGVTEARIKVMGHVVVD